MRMKKIGWNIYKFIKWVIISIDNNKVAIDLKRIAYLCDVA